MAKAKKTRPLSEAEQKARQRRDGLTRKEYNAKHNKFRQKSETGSFEIVALFDGNPVPQTAPFPNFAAAMARFDRLMSNVDVTNLSVIQTTVLVKGETKTMRRETVASFYRSGSQEFANSKRETLYRTKTSNTTITMKQIKASQKLQTLMANGELEVAKTVCYDGSAWWERRA